MYLVLRRVLCHVFHLSSILLSWLLIEFPWVTWGDITPIFGKARGTWAKEQYPGRYMYWYNVLGDVQF